MSRIKNTIRNAISGFLYKILGIISPFILRTLILNILGAEYLGLNGLFSSILNLLNLTELGLTNAIVYSLYEPIEKKDYNRISAILNLIRKAYLIIGISIFILGILIMPFLDKLVKGNYPNNINLQILFVIYILNTCVSYALFAYKNCLLTATQRNDIKTNINSIMKIIELILQIVILVNFNNMYLFVLVQVFCTLLNNLCSYYVTNKIYPQYLCKSVYILEKEEKKKILMQIIGILFDKICCVSRTALDSVFVSAFIGLEFVAKYENYSYISNALYSVINVNAP